MGVATVPEGVSERPRISTFAWCVLAYNILVVVWGALVRATGSGAGCGEHWPLCNGTVVPTFPQWHTAIEFTHRATSGLALLAVIVMYWMVRRVFLRAHLARRAAFYSLVFMINETLVGALLVLLGLVAGSRSPWRAVVLTFHLANTMMLIGSIALTAFWSGKTSPRWEADARGRKMFYTAVLLAVFTAAAGGIAALGDTLFPASSVAAGIQEEFARNAHWMVRLRVVHPVLAVIAGVYFLFMVMSIPVRPWTGAIAGLTIAQFALGGLNIILLTPLWTQLTHLLLTDLLWVSLVLYGASIPAVRKNPEKSGSL
ncbi:MAG: COX15/CtaA family protein [Acidobacteria bacterium]|nr:COX15/CtaA family protein [Acidobacteriota bacterium]